jgi:dihydroorotase
MSQITLPGLIDPHVHLRDPGQTHKEDFYTGTAAALAGGYTTVLDMPNNLEPITNPERLAAKQALAQKRIVCDIGFNFGTLGDNLDTFEQVIDHVTALKVYLNVTTGNFKIDAGQLLAIYKAWPGTKPIMLHAEEDVSELVLGVLRRVKKPTHMCHVSSIAELKMVMQAKAEGLPITCGVTPHHLFLDTTDQARLGSYGYMKPFLKDPPEQAFLWDHLDAIDIIESDHAPHTKAEKAGDNPPFGVPGLETTLPLMLTAERAGRITRRQILDRLHYNPARIFHLPTDPTTQVVVDMDEFVVRNEDLHTKSGWSPFAGRRLIGKTSQVILHGVTVFEHGQVIAPPGSGSLINA